MLARLHRNQLVINNYLHFAVNIAIPLCTDCHW